VEKLTIGQMAKLNHVSEQTLRYYDKIQLLQPDNVNNENGYRYYSIKHCNEFNKEKEYIGRLLTSVKEKGYVIVGDYICEVLTEFPLLERKERGMFLRLQIPIKFR
jgi:effector-binding domain-containing protein